MLMLETMHIWSIAHVEDPQAVEVPWLFLVRSHRQSTPFSPKQISHCKGGPSLGASGPRSGSKGAQGTDEKRKLISRNTTILRSCL